MGGEKSKKSGEIGEAIAKDLITLLGWKLTLGNVSIKCNNPLHVNKKGNQKESHGEDRVYIYHNPFHDGSSEIVHISVKHTLDPYPSDATLKTKLKEYLDELQETIDCAKYSPELKQATLAHGTRKNKNHSGLLLWLCSADSDKDKDIKPSLANVRLDYNIQYPVYLIDNARALFISNIIKNAQEHFKSEAIEFFYPPIGTTITAAEPRSGTFLPLELISSDIVPVLHKNNEQVELTFYANQAFTIDSYTKLISYALQFSSGLVAHIRIGMPNYNPSYHENDAETARMKFADRLEKITPFCFNETILNTTFSED